MQRKEWTLGVNDKMSMRAHRNDHLSAKELPRRVRTSKRTKTTVKKKEDELNLLGTHIKDKSKVDGSQ
jgi:hypothetical protein